MNVTISSDPTPVGVVIARFQTPLLHAVHEKILNIVSNAHPTLVVFLGVAPVSQTVRNPLGFVERRHMVQEKYPKAVILDLPNQRSDQAWSNLIDRRLSELFKGQTATLYGGRDSFLKAYSGKYKTVELESDSVISASQLRKQANEQVGFSLEWRSGKINGATTPWPRVIPTVDIAVVDEKVERVILVKRDSDPLFRFPGGHCETGTESYEADALKETQEETGVEVSNNLLYLGSFLVDDWKYRGEVEKIKTTFFAARYISGPLQAGDDVDEAKWQNIAPTANAVVSEHTPLWRMLINKVETIKKFSF